MTIKKLYNKLSYALSSNPSLKDKEIEWTRGSFSKNKVFYFKTGCYDGVWQVVLKIKKDGKNTTYGELLDILSAFIKGTDAWEINRHILIADDTGEWNKYFSDKFKGITNQARSALDIRANSFRFNDLKFQFYIQTEEIV